ncbi:MAG: ATP-binding protein [bacterium]|nr:ATP-binding protein [bacterium]
MRRSDRYDGGGFSVSLSDFGEKDAVRVQKIYRWVKALYDEWLKAKDAPDWKRLSKMTCGFDDDEIIRTVKDLGASSLQPGEPNPLMSKTLHDIRGGGLTGLLGFAQLLRSRGGNDVYVRKAVFLARDHAKMMRNAVHDLDMEVRRNDESEKAHSIEDFIEKLRECPLPAAEGSVRIEIESDFHGMISNRCLETSAIDRILYNYLNNAARFTADGAIRVYIQSVNEELVRFVVANAIDQSQAAWLNDKLGGKLDDLFLGGFTRGGHGIGLSSCADFVSSCFGVHPPALAVQQGYLGAKTLDGVYYA